MRGKHDPNPVFPGLIYVILIAGLVNHKGTPSQRSQWLFIIPIASMCIYLIFFCASSNPASDYFSAPGIATFFFFSTDYILLRKYQRELRPLGQKPLSEMPLRDRVWWAASLAGNPRGIGWTHEPTRHLPPRPSSTPREFIISQLMWMVFYILQLDIINIFIRTNSCFATEGPSLTAFGWLWRSTVWLHVSLSYCLLALSNTAYSIVSVTIGVSEPRDWPHFFGSLLDGYTVRNCWGRVWHQMLRKLVTDHADFIARRLRLRKSIFTDLFKLFVGFFISGLIHNTGDYILYQRWAGHSLQFFLLQAVAISWEDVIIRLAARAGFSSKPNRFFKFIGFVWVFGWGTYSLPLLLDGPIHAGTMDQGLSFKFSLILGLWRGDWTPSRSSGPTRV